MKKVLILGGSGMLGSMTADVFSKESSLVVSATVRSTMLLEHGERLLPGVNWQLFDVMDFFNRPGRYEDLADYDYIINCIGITKPYCNDNNPHEIINALEINSLFPNLLGQMLAASGTKILQIATDCVYSGSTGAYTEAARHDALDVYGKTKSLGESKFDSLHNLRCSIIGPEFQKKAFLISWFLNQPENAALNGYTNHDWNGLTTLHFAKICLGIVKNDISLPKLQHLVPDGKLSKFDMLRCFAEAYNRNDIVVNRFEAAEKIDRTISTENTELNTMLWSGAGYDSIPTVRDMISELAHYNYSFKAGK